MIEWFSNLEFFPKLYWSIALIGSLIFTVVLVMAFTGGDTDDIEDVDTEIDGDTGIGFQFLTFKNLVGFFTIFGWTGIACIDAGLSNTITLIISILCGLLMMTIMATLFYFMSKLTDSGTLNFKNAINAIGEVYLTIGADRTKMGKVSIRVQGTMRELDALTDALSDLKTGTIIKVVDVTENGILIVDHTKKPIEPLNQETYEITEHSSSK